MVIEASGADQVVFTRAAGGLAPVVQVGDQAHLDFAQFVQKVASQYARHIILELMQLLSK